MHRLQPRTFQVLDGSPARHHTDLSDVEVWVAAKVRTLVTQATSSSDVGGAQSPLGGGQIKNAAVIPNRSVASPKAGRPVGIPVVVEGTTDTPSVRQLETLGGTVNCPGIAGGSNS